MILVGKKIGINGEGICYDHKVPVFVDGLLPNEKAEIAIDVDYGRYKVGHIVKLLSYSPNRIKPICPHYFKCGGCSLMHVKYQEQLNIKKSLAVEALNKYASYDASKWPIVGSIKELGYRNATKLQVKTIKNQTIAGFYQKGTNSIFKLDKCLIHNEELEKKRKIVIELVNKYHLKDYKDKNGLRGIFLRVLDGSEVCFVGGIDKLPINMVKELIVEGIEVIDLSVVKRKNSIEFFGDNLIHLNKPYLDINFEGIDSILSTKSFFQLNELQAAKLYNIAISFLDDEEIDLAVEAYSGVGLISMLMKDKAKRLIGIEIVEEAVKDAKRIAENNGISNIQYLCDDAAKALKDIASKEKIDLLIVDPPRSGLDDNMIEIIKKSKIDKILYISCNPVTLAKNIKNLAYEVEKMTFVDMFPQTAHVETVVLLSREKVDGYVNLNVDIDSLGKIEHKVKPKENNTNKAVQKTYGTATYSEIKEYILSKYNVKVSTLNIGQIKEKFGIKERNNYNKGAEGHKVPPCTKNKEKCIIEAFKHFEMI